MLSFRFRAMYRNLGLSRPDVAQLLHVSERTLHNWETGHHEIPYSAYRLLRLLTRQELPGKTWTGWHITAGVLWSPEGHGFKPEDSSWWSMLCRRSALFQSLYEENSRLRHAARSAAQPAILEQSKGRGLVTPSFFPASGNFRGFEPVPSAAENCPAEQRLARVRLGQTPQDGGAK